jgi:EAL domain-containing protein (putative c-di-GMP-specific phosphodiesterase class I)
MTIDQCDYFITASFGYAEYPKDASNLDTIFACADAAMYEIKRANSSDHILRFSPEHLKLGHLFEIERCIRAAIASDDIFFDLQPQYDFEHNLRGFEALARIRDDRGAVMNPTVFIPVAERVGIIDKVDECVINKSTKFFGELIQRTGSKVTLSVNVSVRHMMKNGFLNEISAIINDCGIPAEQLEIEITESVMIDSVDKALQRINELRDMGVKIAIDDFGTGYSSLSYLNKFPANLLKVDKSFIDKMNSSDSSKKYVAAIISIGHIMNFEVISEGVETPDQLETLRAIGCDYIQGYIWGRPLTPESAEELVVQQMYQ